ncbi:class I SAM-dependent RNA methyltransferase [Timonella senegalensis]|uniref:class I SAM-dependent RNA methyltransferase n=1 Tax=Timonella senegalensis TaxID=1465825 RepID=UPI0028A94EC0|nr:TRAM domain-containing protein [Timonella senegalensis]
MNTEAQPQNSAAPRAEDLVELEIGPVAHGGHCVARLDGRVVFVRHALPGERVLARFTDQGEKSKFWRADAVSVIEPSADRVRAAWPAAGPDGVGGGELSHVSLAGQRAWKSSVVEEQLSRLAGLDRKVTVEAAPGDDEAGGLGWRTRFDLIVDDKGRAGMRGFRSHDIKPLKTMPLASAAALELAAEHRIFDGNWEPGAQLEIVAPANGSQGVVLINGEPERKGQADVRPNAKRNVSETVVVDGVEHTYQVAAKGFWQVHREAPALLAQTVLDMSRGDGELDLEDATVVDLFSGAGLFSVPFAHAVGEVGRVISIEGDERACRDARRNLHSFPQAEVHVGDVAKVLADGDHGAMAGADVVVMDPPRAGAGKVVVEAVAALEPQRVVYVACDPAALARDIKYFAELGYELGDLRAFDLFPMTHHVECVALLVKA